MKIKSDLDLLLFCLGDVLTSHSDRCIGKCNCYENYDKACEIVTLWDAIVKATKL